jgi:iron(III) transport system permease protein
MNVKQALLRKSNIIISVAVLTVLIIIPVVLVLLRSFTVEGTFHLLNPIRTILAGELGEVFVNSIRLAITVVIVTTVIAGPLAWLTGKTELARAKWIDVVLLVPFMTPPYIATMGWILFMQPRGVVDQYLPFLGVFRPLFFSFWGIVLVMSLNLYPFIYLVIKNTLMEINRSLEDAGAVHGGTFTYRMRRVILPLLFSGYTMGALLIFVKTLAEFGTPATLGRRVGFYVFTTEIYRFTNQWPIDFARGTALASVLLITSMAIWYVQQLLANKYSYSIVGGRDHGRKAYRLGKWRFLAWAYVAFLLLLSIGVPYWSIVTSSFMQTWGRGLTAENLTIAHYAQLFTGGTLGGRALWNSLRLSFIAATAAMFLGTFLAVTIIRSQGFIRRLIDVSSLLSNTVPRIVIIVGLILFWNAPWMRNMTVYNTATMLTLTYMVAFLPYTVQYVKANFQQIDVSLFHAAQVCGASRGYITRRILFPLIRPGMVAGWIMTFIISIRELVGSLMIRPAGIETSATFIFRQFDQGAVPLGMAMAMTTVGLTTIVLVIVQKGKKTAASA